MLSTLHKRLCFCLSNLESINYCRRMHYQESEIMFHVTLKGKSGIYKI